MKNVGLRVEHSFQNRRVGTVILEEVSLAVVGSGREAQIRLVGGEVAAVHAAFDRGEQGWTVRDLGSAAGTKVGQKGIVALNLTGATVIQIGEHRLEATPFLIDRALFNKEIAPTAGDRRYQQVVILKNGLVIETKLLEPAEAFEGLAPVNGPEWVETALGARKIRRRLVAAEVIRADVGPTERRAGPVVAALVAVMIIAGFLSLSHQEAKPTENQFTRLIFDGKKIRQKKLVAERLRKAMGNPVAAANPSVPKSAPGAKVVSNLKMSGLGALIGKVAARASKNAKLIESAGVNAETKGTGRALGVGIAGSLEGLGGQTGAGGHSMKVGQLGTAGKGGGATGYHGSGGLAQGGVGQAEVGMVEDETEVDGGLDKEAIARVIRSQLGAIRYCYERQLSASPDLYGKLMVKFTIGAVGSVTAQAIGSSSLNNAMVEGCILRRVAGWQFPTPKGGTNVMVTYPFLFKSTR